ncbi:MAG: protein kinase [Phycisphaerae bacterium]|jgi:serine/threonine-protein kinase
MDTELGKLVVEQKLATAAEVQQVRELKVRAADANERSLAELLVEKGVVTHSQIGRIKKNLEEARGAHGIPGYFFIRRLGSGAMAHVYLAKQESLDRMVAIKVLPPQMSNSPEYVERFYKEGKAAAKLNHANIVQAIDVGESGGYHYFVMEYVEGHTLHDELLAQKVFSESEALRVIIQIGRALEHAHKQGLIHRDVKPKNIMVTKEGGIVKLADMGLARVANDAQAAQAEAGRAFGTPYYISPEQIRGEVNIDFRADIYSLGATLYHLVTGRVPFDGPTPSAVMLKHLKEPLVPPDHINTSLSAGLGEVVEVMMAKDRDERYASTTDLLLDLESIQRGEPPLQARRQIDGKVLKGLTAEAQEEEPAPVEKKKYQPAAAQQIQPEKDERNYMTALVILSAFLAVSVLLNIVLFIMLLQR